METKTITQPLIGNNNHGKDDVIVETIKLKTIPLPSYDYGRSQDTIDFGTQIRNKGDGTRKTTSFTSETSVVSIHNFGLYPIVQVIDGSGVVITPDSITHDSLNQVTVVFSGSTTGNIILVI